MNLRIITKYHETDLEIGLLKKSILKPYGHSTAIPPALELKLTNNWRDCALALCEFRNHVVLDQRNLFQEYLKLKNISIFQNELNPYI